MTRVRKFVAVAIVLAAGALGLVLAPWPDVVVAALAPDPAKLARPGETVFTDRDGRPLRHTPGANGSRGDWQPLARHPKKLVDAVLAAEDMRFRAHTGIDPLAVARAAFDNLRSGRIVSGASTLTQQTVWMLEPRRRTWGAKAFEALRALALERRASKDAILEQYLNRAPMPGNLRGMAAGARLLLDRDLAELSLAECALLAALPQAPGRLDPRREKARAPLEKRRQWVLARMHALGWITEAERAGAARELPAVRRGRFPFRAPHLIDRLAGVLEPAPEVRTTIDGRVQQAAEEVLASHRGRLEAGGARQAACVVLDTRSREVLAWVGSFGWDAKGLGFNDGVVARRSAGSTLKPFVYAVALEKGMTLATPLADVKRTYATPRGDYDPRNYDRREHGPVLARAALGSSLNAAAVEVARRVGPGAIADRLRELGLIDEKRDTRDLGVGIAIGNVEVTLLDLAGAYATLASGGGHRPPQLLLDRARPPARPLIDPGVAYLVVDALADPAPRLLTFGELPCFDFPFPVAVKTGTSTAYRDTWAMAATPRYTVGVWVGNFDGRPTAGLAGATAAAPVTHDVMMALARGQPPRAFARPEAVVEREVCADSGDVPSGWCPRRLRELFVPRPSSTAPAECRWHVAGAGPATFIGPEFAGWLADREARGLAGRHALARADGGPGGIEIEYPHAGDRFVISRSGRSTSVMVSAVPRRTVPFIRWFLDGDEVEATPPPYRWSWTLTRGHHRLLAGSPDLSQTAAIDVHVE